MYDWGNMALLLAVLESAAMETAERAAMETFASNLRRLRTAAGLTQDALATAAGMSRPTISDYERGAADNVELKTIALLAVVLGCTPVDLLRELPAGVVAAEDVRKEYVDRYGKADARSDEFIEWTRTFTPTFWLGGTVDADGLHDVYLHYVKRYPTPQVW